MNFPLVVSAAAIVFGGLTLEAVRATRPRFHAGENSQATRTGTFFHVVITMTRKSAPWPKDSEPPPPPLGGDGGGGGGGRRRRRRRRQAEEEDGEAAPHSFRTLLGGGARKNRWMKTIRDCCPVNEWLPGQWLSRFRIGRELISRSLRIATITQRPLRARAARDFRKLNGRWRRLESPYTSFLHKVTPFCCRLSPTY